LLPALQVHLRAEMSCRFPGGRIGVTGTALLFRLPAFGCRGFSFVSGFSLGRRAYGSRSLAPEGLNRLFCGDAGSPLALAGRVVVSRLRSIPVERNSVLWECNVTPVHGSCQEGNTICCVSSNDGLDAGLRSFFPQWPAWWSFGNVNVGLRLGQGLGCRRVKTTTRLKPGFRVAVTRR
jgi:hypothetical protein